MNTRHVIKVNGSLCDLKRYHREERVIEIYSPLYGPGSINLASNRLTYHNRKGQFQSAIVSLR